MNQDDIILKDGRRAEVQSDGRTVWVNTWYCIGRFSVHGGIDIHQEPLKQTERGQCLFCTHGPTTLEDWEMFKAKMLEFYGASVNDSHRPASLMKN